ALIISGGSPPSFNLLKKYSKGYYIIAADSGCDILFKYNIKPDLIIGDLDSIEKEILNEYLKNNVELTKFPKHKDYSDTELSALEAIDRGAEEITILGATGGRIDHLLANINILYLLNEKGIPGKISDDNNEIFLIKSPAEIKGLDGEYFSIFSMGEDVKEITLTNCKYPLNKYHLFPRDSLILSNEFNGGILKIKFQGGPLIFIKSWD
ncbi:MAG: thiamine diphosphokinase, partial [Bacillota bacterium]|nr:thiamine diphosphokinase [Bacillota bacterium]